MTKFKMENFGGEIPAIDNRLMPENAGALSINTWLMSGRVEPLQRKTYEPEKSEDGCWRALSQFDI